MTTSAVRGGAVTGPQVPEERVLMPGRARGLSLPVIYGLALGHSVSQTLELLSECKGASARVGGSELLCQLGARKDAGEHVGLMGAVGRAVAGDSDERVELQGYLGVQLRW